MENREQFNAKTRRREVIHLTMKNMKVMKIIHESVNERANDRVHSLTPFFPQCPQCPQWLKGFPLCLCALVRDMVPQ